MKKLSMPIQDQSRTKTVHLILHHVYSKVPNKRTVQCKLINFLKKSPLYALIKDL